jgi:disulfide bond formation protein DsbB
MTLTQILMSQFSARVWPLWAAKFALLALAFAHISEQVFKLYPCDLCLRQREVYWAALTVIVVGGGLLLWRRGGLRLWGGLNLALAAVFAVGVGVAGYHAGVEWGVFAPLSGCTVASADALPSAADILKALSEPQATASCTDAPWRVHGLSMAGWNGLLYLALMAASLSAGLGAVTKAKVSP